MTTIVKNLKRGAIAAVLLVSGFAGGWLSAVVLGGRMPLDGDLTALFGPGRVANQATPSSYATSLAPSGRSGTWSRTSSTIAIRSTAPA